MRKELNRLRVDSYRFRTLADHPLMRPGSLWVLHTLILWHTMIHKSQFVGCYWVLGYIGKIRHRKIITRTIRAYPKSLWKGSELKDKV